MITSTYKTIASPRDSPVKNSPRKNSPVKIPVKNSPVKNVVFSRPSQGNEDDDDDDVDYEDYDLYGGANDDDDEGLGELQYVDDPIQGQGKGGLNQGKGGTNISAKPKVGHQTTPLSMNGNKGGEKGGGDVKYATSSSYQTNHKGSKNGWNRDGDDNGIEGGEEGSVGDQDSLDDVYPQSSNRTNNQPSSSTKQQSTNPPSPLRTSPSKGKVSSSHNQHPHQQQSQLQQKQPRQQQRQYRDDDDNDEEEERFSDLSGDERARLTPGQQQQRRASNLRKNITTTTTTSQKQQQQQQQPFTSMQKSMGESGGVGGDGGRGIEKHSIGFDRRGAPGQGLGLGLGLGNKGMTNQPQFQPSSGGIAPRPPHQLSPSHQTLQQQQKRQEAIPTHTAPTHVHSPPLLPTELETLKKKKKKSEPWRVLKPLSVRAFVEVPVVDVDDKYV